MTNLLKIRCSSLGSLMTEPREKKLKDAGELSATAKKEIRKIWISRTYGKEKDYTTKYTEKGIYCEEKGISMFNQYIRRQIALGEWKFSDPVVLTKNELRKSNEYFDGLPDLVEADFGADIKCSWDLDTYMEATADDHIEQMQGYMDLFEPKIWMTVFCLVDAPEWLIDWEIRAIQRKADPDLADDIAKAVRRNMTFDNVPEDEKVKVFISKYDPLFINSAYDKVIKAREYYGTLSLTPKQLQDV